MTLSGGQGCRDKDITAKLEYLGVSKEMYKGLTFADPAR